MKAIIPYFDLCAGCHTCELACSMVKFNTYAPRLSHVQLTTESNGLRAQPNAYGLEVQSEETHVGKHKKN